MYMPSKYVLYFDCLTEYDVIHGKTLAHFRNMSFEVVNKYICKRI